MRANLTKYIAACCAVLALAACENGALPEPPTDKPIDQRRVLLLDALGNVYDQTGAKVSEVPNCDYATQIIADGDDWFVSGMESGGKIGYWKNGKWNTLHVDNLDDVDHTIYGMGKWDSYIYLFDYPHVLKNSGIFRLEGSDMFIPAYQALAVSKGQCYVVGSMIRDFPSGNEEMRTRTSPVYYYLSHDKYVYKELPLPEGETHGTADGIYAHDGNRLVICGTVGRQAVVWVDDRQPQVLELSYSHDPDLTITVAAAHTVTCADGVVYAGGYEVDNEQNRVATLWRDGVPTLLTSGDASIGSSEVLEVLSYGKDVYVLTNEYALVDEDTAGDITYTLLWVNGEVMARFTNILAVNIAVL